MYPIPILSSILTTDRTQRVKDARTEAAKEIEAYKAQKAKDFEKFEAEVPTLFMQG